MQIFVTHPDPIDSAIRLYNEPKRALKMITETQQILACVQEYQNHNQRITTKDGNPYTTPKSRMNHPVVIWAVQKPEHAAWLVRHLEALHMLYDGEGFRNVPKNITTLWSAFNNLPLDNITFLNFAKNDAKKLDFTHIDNVFEAYDFFLKAQGA